MDVFSLRDAVVGEYKVRDLLHDHPGRGHRRQVEAIYAENATWPEPLIQINPKSRGCSRKSGRDANSVPWSVRGRCAEGHFPCGADLANYDGSSPHAADDERTCVRGAGTTATDDLPRDSHVQRA